MEEQFTKLGSSIMVPNVQELAKEVSQTIPSRYVRSDLHDHVCSSLTEVPVVNMERLLDDETSMDMEFDNLHNACKEWGFFQVINHGVDSSIVKKMKVETQKFFNLSLEEKTMFAQEVGEIEGYGQAFVVSEEQKLDWADMFYINTLPSYLRKPHLIPKLPTAFREAIEAYAVELKSLALKILMLMAKALDMEEEDMSTLFDDGRQSMKMNYYPPCLQPELAIGIYPHSDAAGLTILLQVNETEGLQIKKHGLWIPISPLPDAFVINIGDILEIVTNGKYRSVEHRATVNSVKERLSIATFFSPKLDGDFGPAPSLVSDPQSPPKFKRISAVDYLKGLFSRKLDGKSYIDSMRID